LIVETCESRFKFFDNQRSNECSFEKKEKNRKKSRKRFKKMFQQNNRANEIVCRNDYKNYFIIKKIVFNVDRVI
jgi:hypothetical protein